MTSTATRFQFHKGSIKTKMRRIKTLSSFGFNSIKVRLRQDGARVANTYIEFQFHKGSIKTQLIAGVGRNVVVSIP